MKKENEQERTAGLVTMSHQGILVGRLVSHSIRELWMKAFSSSPIQGWTSGPS
jgi:hypothetical protein